MTSPHLLLSLLGLRLRRGDLDFDLLWEEERNSTARNGVRSPQGLMSLPSLPRRRRDRPPTQTMTFVETETSRSQSALGRFPLQTYSADSLLLLYCARSQLEARLYAYTLRTYVRVRAQGVREYAHAHTGHVTTRAPCMLD